MSHPNRLTRKSGVHTCHANGCGVPTPPRFLMCARHWRQVPIELQTAVWTAYRGCQGAAARVSDPKYLRACAEAVEAVAQHEGIPIDNPYRRRLEVIEPRQRGNP